MQQEGPGMSAAEDLPEIDCVIIGVNSEKTLERCIKSILSGSYPESKLHVVYSDGGSTDRSVSIARQFGQVQVVEMHPEYPTPGLGRNAGWRRGRSAYVQFLDSDTILDPEWLKAAIEAMRSPAVGAVRGYRKELHPERSFFNWIGDLEWNTAPGECDSFGGDVLVRRSALEESGGYDEELVGGEDPELSWRISRSGWKIIMLDALMTNHDLAMLKTSQYLKRSFRSGYAFAAVKRMISGSRSDFWKADWRRIVFKSSGFFVFSCLGFLLLLLLRNLSGLFFFFSFFAAGCAMLFSPRLFRVEKFMKENRLNRTDAKKYAWHCSLVVLPQFFGFIRFYYGLMFNKPLRNRRSALKTGLSTSPGT